MGSLTDTHCHLDFEAFDADRQEVLERAWAVGVVRILNPGVDARSSQAALELAREHPGVFAAVGVHPNRAAVWDEGVAGRIKGWSIDRAVVAIGEIGLDYYRDATSPDLQREVFRAQLDLAMELDLPVVVHNRDATEDVVAILVEWQQELARSGSSLATRPGVLHSFSGSEAAARRAIQANFFIGVTGPVTFSNATALQETVSHLPLDRILIETDAPFLSPAPFRGRRNEPCRVRHTAERIAELHGLPLEALSAATTENAKRLFRWEEMS